MLTFEQASRLSNDPILGAIFKSAFKVDKLFAMLPWARVQGKGHTYIREGSQISANFIDAGGVITPSEQGVLRVTANLRTIAASAQIPGSVVRNLNDNFDQAQVQIQSIARALARKIKTALVTGSWPTVTMGATAPVGFITAVSGGPYLKAGTGQMWVDVSANKLYFQAPGDVDFGAATVYAADGSYTVVSADGVQQLVLTLDVSEEGLVDAYWSVSVASTSYEFDGLRSVVTNTLTGPTANGDAISFGLLRQLIDAVDPDAGQRVIVTAPRTVRAIKALMDALGGTHAEQIQLAQYGIDESVLGFEGIPILTNDYLPIDETKGATNTCTSLYCLSLAPATGAPSNAPFQAAGIAGLYGAGQRQETDEGPVMGITVKIDETPRDGDGKLKDAVEVAIMGDFALASYGTKSSARLYGITN